MLALRRLVAVGAIALALTACSNDKNVVSGNPQAALAAAATRTAQGKSVKMSLKATSGSLKVLTGTGAYDFTHSTGRITMSGAVLANLDIIITPDKVYVRTPNQPKKWAALTQADLDKAGSTNPLSSIRSQIDPRETLRNLGQTTNVQMIGSETVRGTKTTHVRGDVDLSDAAIAKAPAAEQAGLRKARDAIQATSYPIDVWFDKDGRVRRLAYAVTAGTGVQRATTTVEFELYDYGKNPGIVIPKPSDVKEGAS